MKTLVQSVTNWLCENGGISQQDKELYEYAVFQFVFTLVPFAFFVLVCSAFGKTLDSILMVLPFILLRKYSGGIHLSSPISCFFSSACLLAVSFSLAYLTVTYNGIIVFSCVLGIAGISLWLHSPIGNAAKPLTEAECRTFRKVARCMVLLGLAIYAVLIATNLWHRAAFWGMGLIIAAALQLPCLFRRKCT